MKEIKEFCDEIKAVKYFSNDEAALKRLGVEYQIFGTWRAAWDEAWNSAWDAARRAAWDEAWCAAWDATLEAAWIGARSAAWEAAWCAAWDAALDAAQGATLEAAWDMARNAAWSAALQCCITTACKDLDIPQEHRDYASQAWGIWQAGYGVLERVENVFYLYEKP